MDELVKNFIYFWDYRMSPMWSLFIPVLLFVIGLYWFFLVYHKRKFSFLPAFAIARVTILDSIGRLEVVLLLIIGMLVVGVNGIIPNTMQGRSTLENWMEHPFFREHLEDLSGASSPGPGNEEIVIPGFEDGQVSAGGDEFGALSVAGEEEGVTISGDETEGPSGIITEGGLTRAEELAARKRASTLEALIWQGAFLIADFFVALIGFVLAMVVLPNEIGRGVILSILPKPVSREEYVFGKAMGIWIIVSGCFLILMIELFVIQGAFDLVAGRYPINWRLIMAMALFPFKYATLVLIIMGLTLRMPEVPAGIVGVAFFTAGHFVDRIYEIAISPLTNPYLGYALRFAYWVLPHLSQATFSILDRDETMITTWGELWGWVWQIVIYNIILLSLLTWLFRRRSL